MAKNPIITEDVKARVKKFYLRHKKWKTKDIQKRVSQLLHRENPELPEGWPGISSVRKILAPIKNRTPDPLDETWSFGSLAKYPIPPEAIPTVISIFEKCDQDSGFFDEWMPSIREMLWVGRLHKIIEIYHSKCIRRIQGWKEEEREEHRRRGGYPPQWYEKIKLEDLILNWAYKYSENEVMIEQEDEFKPDGIGLPEDQHYIMIDVFDDCDYRLWAFIETLADKYGIDEDKFPYPDQFRDSNFSIGYFISQAKQIVFDEHSKNEEAQNERTHNQEG